MYFDSSKINIITKFYEYLYKKFDKVFIVSEEGRENRRFRNNSVKELNLENIVTFLGAKVNKNIE